jgi:hypothetical protein
MALPTDDILPLPAISGLLDVFARTPLVAVGELHGLQELADFLVALLYHPRFSETVDAIVVEFGNSRYQALMDRFINGEPVANHELRPIWRDTFSWGTADAPIYEQFFRTVRAINRTLSPDRHLSVLLGDPPINWSQVHDWQDIHPFIERDRHFATVVEQNILAQGRRGLLIAGAWHTIRLPTSPVTPTSQQHRHNIIGYLEASHPGSTYSIVPHVGFGRRNSELEPRLATWPIPALSAVHNTWLGELSIDLLFAADQAATDMHSPTRHTLKEVADGYLYLGPRDTLTRSRPNPAIYRGDTAYLAELERRRELFYASHTLEELWVEEDPRYRRPNQ